MKSEYLQGALTLSARGHYLSRIKQPTEAEEAELDQEIAACKGDIRACREAFERISGELVEPEPTNALD